MNKSTTIFFSVFFLFSLIVMLIPLPRWADFFRPEFVGLTIIYWQLIYAERINLLGVVLLGLLLDGLQNVFLGEHVLALLIISYFLLKFHQRIKMFTLPRQMLMIFLLLAVYQGILLILTLWLHTATINDALVYLSNQYLWLHLSNIIISVLIWPWWVMILDNLQRIFIFKYTK